MKRKTIYAGIVSFGIAVVFALLNLTKIETSFNQAFLANISIYPVAFFALLGLVLIYLGMRPLWRS